MEVNAVAFSNIQVWTMLPFAVIGLTVLLIIVTIMAAVNASRLKKLQESYDAFFSLGAEKGISIEELLHTYIDETRHVSLRIGSLDKRTSSLESRITGCFQKIAVIRYNPFDDTGGDLSYAIALLDDKDNGFILNGIFNRSGSFTYAKEIENGLSIRHKLSEEEHIVLQNAINGVRR